MKLETLPRCPYFGRCGGCAHQNLSYEEELRLKEENLSKLFQEKLDLSDDIFSSIVSSPESYGYRSRLDLSLRRMRGAIEIGFNEEGTRRFVPIDSCAIARWEINNFLAPLRRLASEKLPNNYRSANLVIKTGEDGRVRWGGIGRGSLRVPEADYFWTEIEGRRIFYSLDTFFQANLGILPSLIKKLRALLGLTPDTYLLDLYAGVGLFWVIFAPEAKGVWAVEESGSALGVAEFNRRYHQLHQVVLKEQRTENCLEEIIQELDGKPQAAIIDPPRKGLSLLALEKLTKAKSLNPLIYISCHPPSLVRDLAGFLKSGWQVDSVVPFDFFPRTRHLEVVVRLRPPV